MCKISLSSKVHLIVTCSRRKTVAAGETVFPDERDVERLTGSGWTGWQRSGENPLSGSGELYTGQYWNRVCAATASIGTEQWILGVLQRNALPPI